MAKVEDLPESISLALLQKSKSQLKREMTALQDLGEELVELTPSQLAKLALPEALQSAVEAARDMTQRGAHKRQLQYIGRVMRELDAEPIRQALEAYKHPGQQATAKLHKIERWRERLLTEGDSALQQLCEEFPGGDRQHLRQLLRNAQAEQEGNKPPRSIRLLFQYLRELMAQGG